MVSNMIFQRKRAIIGDRELFLQELSGADAIAIWPRLTDAEKSGNFLESFFAIVAAGVVDQAGSKVYTPTTASELPIRLVSSLAEDILALSEVGVDMGKVDAAPDNTGE